MHALLAQLRRLPSGDEAPARLSYLCGILSLTPILGLFFGSYAVVAGVQGIRYGRRHPESDAALRSWMGLLIGGFFASLYLALTVVLLPVLF